MKFIQKISLSICALSLVACNDFETLTTESALDHVNSGKAISSKEVPECLVEYEEYQLDVHLNAFEIYSKKGFQFGFNLGEGLLQLLGFSFKTEKGLMSLYMGLSESVNPTSWVSYVEGQATMKKRDFRFNIGVSQFNGGLSYFKQTPMNTLTGNSIKNGFSNMEKEMEAKQVNWKTRVVHSNEGQSRLVVPVGNVSGLRIGDQFNVFNVNYVWEGDPCVSELLIPAKTTTKPIAITEVVQVENNAAVLLVIDRFHDDIIELGAMVEINQLTDETRKLSHSVKVRNVSAHPIPVDEGLDLDLTRYLDEQSRAFMDGYNMNPMN